MSWIKDIIDPKSRAWEEFYRNRNQCDKVVRSTHGVNCTGGCSWNVHVKDGIVGWELQATDYPELEPGLPPYEPRGCQRGISFSWYLYSPLRIKYPYMRGLLVDLWRAAKAEHGDPVLAWAAIMENPAKRKSYQQARGKGGFRRVSWDEAEELIAASSIYTIKKFGADRLVGFSPIPAMSMLSFAGGSRFMQLMGGANLSFYDWYCDLPNASPEIWGEQTDVAESADWYNSKYIAVVGSNPDMTRTPDAHFLSEARHNGTKVTVFAPDFNITSKHADWWIPAHAGQDGAFWMAVNHVILSEFHHQAQTPFFLDYLKRYTDTPFLIELEEKNGVYRAGRMARAGELERYSKEENGNFKYLVWDETSQGPRMPLGSLGFRWQEQKGQWNLQMKDGQDGADLSPALSLLDDNDAVLQVAFDDFSADQAVQRGVPVRYLATAHGQVAVTTVFDLLMAQFGVKRGLAGAYPADYDAENDVYTPAWQEKYTGIDRANVIQFAREWASTAEKTGGKCSIIIGAGANHWYHSNLIYRAGISALMLCGCVGKNGGGLNHYVGQEKLAPAAPWATIMGALDWSKPPRFQNAPSYHYVHTDQWRYERTSDEARINPVAEESQITGGHTMDHQVRAVRNGWLPFYPQFDRSPIEAVKQAEAAGAKNNQEIVAWTVQQLANKTMKFAIEDPDAPENWPRLWIIWRGNALMSSAKGHEYFLKHYLGTHTNTIAPETAEEFVKEVKWHKDAPQGKLDLVVDINFRMDTSALYSDIVLPTATWYEKDDLNTTDMHSFIHPLQAAVPPCWESKSDWDIFKGLAKKVSHLAETHLPDPIREIVSVPLQHDTPAEMAQFEIKDWSKGECAPIPGKTMPGLVVVERDYKNLYNRFISLGPEARKGMGAHGLSWSVEDYYDEMVAGDKTVSWNGKTYPTLVEARDAAEIILKLAPETNGEMAFRAFEAEEKKVGLPLTDLAAATRGVRTTFADLAAQPRRLLNSPIWSGLNTGGRAYSAYCLNVEKLVPWRTLTGRQHFYLDHQGYIAAGEHLPTYKPKPDHGTLQDFLATDTSDQKSIMLNYLTPHGKWSIHTTYSDNHRMLTLSRGCHPFWINDQDAEQIGVFDNDWVEVYNDHGVVVTRAIVSSRLPRGISFLYHATERTIGIPKSPLRGNKRAGGHNSLNRIRLKPSLMLGGYGQFTYAWNYWGPPGANRDTYIMVRKLEGEPQW